MGASDWIALAALAVSMISLWRTRRLAPLEEELAKVQLRQAEEADVQKNQANVMISLEGKERLVIRNHGPADAEDITIDEVDTGDKDSPIIQSELERKLPIRHLAPGGEVRLITAFAFGKAASFVVKWSWKDPDGKRRISRTQVSI